MSEQLYRIKPLVWGESEQGVILAETVPGFGYGVTNEGHWYVAEDDVWQKANSIDAAKAAAEQHHRNRLESMLEPVT